MGLPESVLSSAAWDAIKRAWRAATGRSLKDSYVAAFKKAFERQRPTLEQHTGGSVGYDARAVPKAIVRAGADPERVPLSRLTEPSFVADLAQAMVEERVLQFQSDALADADCEQLARNFVQQANAIFGKAIQKKPESFAQALQTQTGNNGQLLQEILQFLVRNFPGLSDQLGAIREELLRQGVLIEGIADTAASIQKDTGDIKALLKDGAITPPPPPAPARLQPDFAHTYPLQANFTGRVAERKALTTWFMAQDDPVYALIAIGGMGKSALTWVWLLQDVLGQRGFGAEACAIDEAHRPDGVLWWSFYDTSATFPAFLERAIRYASNGAVDLAKIPSESERVDTLLRLLRERPILLVLDGAERRLRAYAGLDAVYQGDADEDTEASLRECIDPHFGTFLASAASTPMPSRVLITSRLMPRELVGNAGNPLDGCCAKELRGFDPADAVAFFRAEGIKGTRAEIEAACRPYDYHPLALGLLAGVIKKDRRTPNDIRVAAKHPVTADLKGRAKHHILVVAYDALDAGHRTLLSTIAAFRNPMDYDTQSAVIPHGDETEFGAMLDELVDRGLLLFDAPPEGGPPLCDLHPIVRQHAYDRLTDKQGVHTRMRDHFQAVPAPEDTKQVARIGDLDPIIELYHHTVRAGQFDEARRLFRDRLAGVLYYRFGAYQTCVELLSALFPNGEPLTRDGEAVLPLLEDEAAQAWTLAELANSYALSGQSRCAVPLREMHNDRQEKAARPGNLAIGLGNLALDNIRLGQLAAAEGNLRRRIDLCREIEDEYREAIGHRNLGRLLTHQGAFGEAQHELDQAAGSFNSQRQSQGEGVTVAYLALCALLMGNAHGAREAAGRALELWHETARKRFPYERDRVRVEWLLGWAWTALAVEEPAQASGPLAEAETHLTEAITRCRRINLVDHEADILLAWARWHRAKGDAPRAYAAATEALSIADRCGYRLKQADCHNFLARLALDAGDRVAARDHAERARDYATCDGPPHCYKPALEEAGKMLEEVASC